MRVFVEHDAPTLTYRIYIQERPGVFLQVVGHNLVKSMEVAPGTEAPEFLTLSEDIWEAIKQDEEFNTNNLLREERQRVDKLIDALLGDRN